MGAQMQTTMERELGTIYAQGEHMQNQVMAARAAKAADTAEAAKIVDEYIKRALTQTAGEHATEFGVEVAQYSAMILLVALLANATQRVIASTSTQAQAHPVPSAQERERAQAQAQAKAEWEERKATLGSSLLECLRTMSMATTSPKDFVVSAQTASQLLNKSVSVGLHKVAFEFIGTPDGSTLLRRFETILAESVRAAEQAAIAGADTKTVAPISPESVAALRSALADLRAVSEGSRAEDSCAGFPELAAMLGPRNAHTRKRTAHDATRQFRLYARSTHPDKGGTPEDFHKLSACYNQVKETLEPSPPRQQQRMIPIVPGPLNRIVQTVVERLPASVLELLQAFVSQPTA